MDFDDFEWSLMDFDDFEWILTILNGFWRFWMDFDDFEWILIDFEWLSNEFEGSLRDFLYNQISIRGAAGVLE